MFRIQDRRVGVVNSKRKIEFRIRRRGERSPRYSE